MFYIHQIFDQSNMFGTNILEHDPNMKIHVRHRIATTENVVLQKTARTVKTDSLDHRGSILLATLLV